MRDKKDTKLNMMTSLLSSKHGCKASPLIRGASSRKNKSSNCSTSEHQTSRDVTNVMDVPTHSYQRNSPLTTSSHGALEVRQSLAMPNSFVAHAIAKKAISNRNQLTKGGLGEDADLSGYVITLQKLDALLKEAIKSGIVSIEETTIIGTENSFEL